MVTLDKSDILQKQLRPSLKYCT